MRIRACLHPALLSILLLLSVHSLGGLEISGIFQMENLGFTANRASSDTTFSGTDLFWGGSLDFTHTVSDNFVIEAGLFRDLILRNVAYALLQYTTDYASFGVGTFLGIFNSDAAILKSGVSISARLGIPGVLYVSAHTDNSLGGRAQLPGDYALQRTDIAVGFYVRNAICSLALSSKDFILTQGATQVVDDLTSYTLTFDMFRKNTPLRILLSMAYQTLSKEFLDGVTNPTVTLNSIILGAALDVDITRNIAMVLDFSTSVYSWGTGLLALTPGFGYETFLFRARAGFRLDLQPEDSDRQGK
jgi:hypothetical protein